MLKTVKSTTLTGQSKVTDSNGNEVTVVQLSASMNETGTSNIVSTIVNREAYEVNKTDCRADMDAFTAAVRELEDLEEKEEEKGNETE